jgi:hypothetical protein
MLFWRYSDDLTPLLKYIMYQLYAGQTTEIVVHMAVLDGTWCCKIGKGMWLWLSPVLLGILKTNVYSSSAAPGFGTLGST